MCITLFHPFNAAYLPLDYSGNPGVNVSHREECLQPEGDMEGDLLHLPYVHATEQHPATILMCTVSQWALSMQGRSEKSDQTGLVPVLHIWVIIVGG
jgi:hypothetical protein